jgi:hypothetical protein
MFLKRAFQKSSIHNQSPFQVKEYMNFPFSANKEGNFIIAPVTLSYFDVTEKKYKTVSSKPIHVGSGIH